MTSGVLHGRATRRIETEHLWLEFLSEGGPRVVGFGLCGQRNVFAETPDASWDSGFGTFELVGGHRLWFAPESSACSFPDSTGLTIEAIDGGVRLIGAPESAGGIQKTIELAPGAGAGTGAGAGAGTGAGAGAARVRVRHVIENVGRAAIELAPWPVTQVRLGGVARVELPGFSRDSAPSQLIAMWPYSSWSDPRLSIRDGELIVRGQPGEPFKIGCFNTTGRVAYELDGVRFTKTYAPAAGLPHADLGVNLEIYVDGRTVELESLGPLVKLHPGERTSWTEDWELAPIEAPKA